MNNEKGLTLLESVASLFFITIFITILINIYILGSQKTSYLEKDSNVLRFEQSVSNWIEKDFRQNRIVSIETSGNLNNVDEIELKNILKNYEQYGRKLIFNLGNDEILYENRDGGFYRIENKKSTLLTEEKLIGIAIKDNFVAFVYSLQGENKVIKIKLNK